jgi:hypothetical protein
MNIPRTDNSLCPAGQIQSLSFRTQHSEGKNPSHCRAHWGVGCFAVLSMTNALLVLLNEAQRREESLTLPSALGRGLLRCAQHDKYTPCPSERSTAKGRIPHTTERIGAWVASLCSA